MPFSILVLSPSKRLQSRSFKRIITLGRGSLVPESMRKSWNCLLSTFFKRFPRSSERVSGSDHSRLISLLPAAEPSTPISLTLTAPAVVVSLKDEDLFLVPTAANRRALG